MKSYEDEVKLIQETALGWRFYDGGDTVDLPWDGDERTVTLNGVLRDGDLKGIFDHMEYSMLDVKDRVVIDVGANIGDSAVYFALRGAKRVVAIEPFPVNAERARKNAIRNGLGDRIEVLLAGCSGSPGFVTVSTTLGSTRGVNANYAPGTVGPCAQVPFLTLEDIKDRYRLSEGAVLKVDCEGCEYGIFESATERALGPFSQIQIEYHYGPQNLVERLRRLGFHTRSSRGSTGYNESLTPPQVKIGYILASRGLRKG